MRDWLQLYRRGGFDALYPKPRADRGRPRQINRIAHYALSAAALDQARPVNSEHLQRALDELRP